MSKPARERPISPASLKTLSRRSNAKGLLQLAAHLAVIGATATGIWAAGTTPWLAPAMLAHGLALVALFAVIHETVHATAFDSRRLNMLVGWLAGLPSLLNWSAYRHFHNAHHRHTQDPARDPELQPPPPVSRTEFWWRMTAIPYWRGRAIALWRLSRGDFTGADYVPQAGRAAVVISVRLMMAVYGLAIGAALSAGSAWPLFYWIGPVMLGQPFLRAYLMCEHTGCPESADGFANTRTTLAALPVRFLMWNMPFHAEHHLYPSVPFHALPALHRHLRPHLDAIAPGYLPTLRAIHAGLKDKPA